MYSQIQYMPVPIAQPYNHYMTMLFSPQSTGYSPVWSPPYVVAAVCLNISLFLILPFTHSYLGTNDVILKNYSTIVNKPPVQ